MYDLASVQMATIHWLPVKQRSQNKAPIHCHKIAHSDDNLRAYFSGVFYKKQRSTRLCGFLLDSIIICVQLVSDRLAVMLLISGTLSLSLTAISQNYFLSRNSLRHSFSIKLFHDVIITLCRFSSYFRISFWVNFVSILFHILRLLSSYHDYIINILS